MSLGNLSIKVSADVGGFTSNMDLAAKAAQTGMGASSSSVDDFRNSLLKASNDMRTAALAMGANMEAANDAIVSSSDKATHAIQNTVAAAGDQVKTLGDRIKDALGAGVTTGLEYLKKAIETALAVRAAYLFSEALGGVIAKLFEFYAIYRGIKALGSFFVGLFTGDSYKNESIDALIKANDQVKEIQKSLLLTAQQASATNAAIAALGVNKSDYTTVFEGAAKAVRANTEELDRLGVKYKDTAGKLLPLDQVVQNVNKSLNTYTEGWDRNQAATAMGLGTAAQVAAAATVTKSAISEASARLNDYNLGIGEESQAAVKRYEAAMVAFNRETELTSSGFKRAWADQIMPILTDFAEFFKDGFPVAVNAFRYSMATITSLFYGLKTVVYMVSESIVGSISAIGIGLEGVAVAGMRVLKGDFSGAKDALVSGWTDAKNRLGGIGDNIVEQARHNSAAMRQAWAMDDRNEPGITKAKDGKAWVAKPDDAKKAAAGAPVLLDDVAKQAMLGTLREQDAFITEEKTLLQTREQFLQNYYSNDQISAKDYYTTTQTLIKDNLSKTLDAYDKEIAAIEHYIEVHKTESDKKADIVAAENRITDIRRKKVLEETATNRELAFSYMDLANERTRIANSLLKSDEVENRAYKTRISILTAFRDAQLHNAIEGNKLLEEENQRHTVAMQEMQAQHDLTALDQAATVGDQMYQILKNAGQEQTALGKALFLANKAIAVAEILINTEVAAAKAQVEGGTFAGFALSSIIRAAGYASAGIVAGMAIADASAEGGYDIPAGVNPVTQLHQKEMVLPAAQAEVIRGLAKNGDSGGSMKLTIVNQTAGKIGNVVEQRISANERTLIIQEAVAATSAQFDDPNSRTSKAIGRNFSMQRTR